MTKGGVFANQLGRFVSFCLVFYGSLAVWFFFFVFLFIPLISFDLIMNRAFCGTCFSIGFLRKSKSLSSGYGA